MNREEFLVAPSILSADFSRLADEVAAVERAGCDYIHVDVMDGHFVPNLTIGAPVVKCLKPVSQNPLDVHLMIEQPERYIDDFAEAGADILTIHVESTDNIEQTLRKIRNKGLLAGLTARPSTAFAELVPFLELVDLVLVMTVNPGFGGQSFMRDQVERVNQLDELRRSNQDLNYLIEVDGGVNDQTARELRNADILVAGSFIYKQSDYAEPIKKLKEAKYD